MRNCSRSDLRGCRVIMRAGRLLRGMAMPKLPPPPLDPNPDKRVQAMRDAWDLRVIAWDGVWPDGVRPRFAGRRAGYQLGRAS